MLLFLTSFTSKLISICDLSFNKCCNLLIISAPPPDVQLPNILVEKLLFSSVMLKTELIASKLATANNHFPSSEKFIVVLKEKVSFCLFNLFSSVSWGLVVVFSMSASVCFLIKFYFSLFIFNNLISLEPALVIFLMIFLLFCKSLLLELTVFGFWLFIFLLWRMQIVVTLRIAYWANMPPNIVVFYFCNV